MKRFSKIFCVALVAIIFWSSIGIHQITFATTRDDQCQDTNTEKVAISANELLIVDTQKAILDSCEKPTANYDYGYCHCKAINLIVNLYSKLYPGDYQSLINGTPRPTVLTFNTELTSALTSASLSNGSAKDFANAYIRFSEHIPDDKSYAEDVNVKVLLDTLDDNTKLSGLKTALTATLQAAHETTITEAFQNEGGNNEDTCSSGFNFWKISTWLTTFNCWIVVLMGKVVNAGVHLMGLFIDPSWWGGISTNPAVKAGFSASIGMVNIIFSVVLVIMAIGTILNLKSYRINDLITKFIIVALLINFTIVIAGSVIDLANYLSLYFLNLTSYSTTSGSLTDAWMGIFSGVTSRSRSVANFNILLITLFVNILILIALVWAFGSILISLVKRGFMLIFLLIISPFAVIAYLLPAKGMGQWWEKWKQALLKNTFYGVYVAAGLYLGTIMLQSLCQSFNTDILGTGDMNFMSGLMLPIMASGFLIYLVLLADELAGGSAKAAAEGASKVALGLAAGGLAAGASGIVTKIGTSKQVSELATNLSKRGGLSAALGTRLSSFNKTSQGKAQESRKAVEAKLDNENPEAYKDKVDTLLKRTGSGATLNSRDQQFLAAALSKLPDKQRKALSPDAQKAIPQFTDSMFKAGILSKPEQKNINNTVPVRTAQFKTKNDYEKASKALEKETDPEKIKQLERDRKAAITDNVTDIINVFRHYRESDPNRKDDIVQSVKDINCILTSNDPSDVALTQAIYSGLLTFNDPLSICNMVDEIQKTDALDVEDPQNEGKSLKTVFMEKITGELTSPVRKDSTQVKKIMREAIKERHNAQFADSLKAAGIPVPKGKGTDSGNDDEEENVEPPSNSNNGEGE